LDRLHFCNFSNFWQKSLEFLISLFPKKFSNFAIIFAKKSCKSWVFNISVSKNIELF
jgi:hypothetical protein